MNPLWLRCPECGKRYWTYGGILKHMESHIPVEERRADVRLQALYERAGTEP